MKPKLKIFQDFVASLLPHELIYLHGIHQFQDAENIDILQRMYRWVVEGQKQPFDDSIDKRKYSAIIQWVNHKLAAVDVDIAFEQASELDRRIMTDTVDAAIEKQLMQLLRTDASAYYFMRYYELLRNYRQYLLIRMRFKEHRQVNDWLEQHAGAFERAQRDYQRLHAATLELTQAYQAGQLPSQDWARELGDLFLDASRDGLNRYLALVRLTFWHYNQRSYEQLLPFFDALESAFTRGQFYSKRLLMNYYSNRLLLHAQLDQLPEAAVYGYLSVRNRNADYVYYLTNLSAVLLRQHKAREAMELLRKAFPDLKQSTSFHTRTSFVAHYVRCLNETGQPQEGEKYAENFVNAYKEEVFEQRWHLLYTNYLQALLMQKKFAKLIRTVRLNKLMERELDYRKRRHYSPALSWYYAIARFHEGQIEKEDLRKAVDASLESLLSDVHRRTHLLQLCDEVRKWAPDIFDKVRSGILHDVVYS